MSWIAELPGNLPGVYSVISTNPRALAAVQELNQSITFGSSALTQVQEEAISTVVSVANRCRY